MTCGHTYLIRPEVDEIGQKTGFYRIHSRRYRSHGPWKVLAKRYPSREAAGLYIRERRAKETFSGDEK